MIAAVQLDLVRRTIQRSLYPGGLHSDPAQRQSQQRRVSLAFAAELRRRGWLSEEGYAAGSWAKGSPP